MSLLLIPAWRRSRRSHTTSWQAARKLTTASWTSWWERPVARVCSAPSGRSTVPRPTRPYSRPFFVKSTGRSPSRRAGGQPHTKTAPIRSLPAAGDTRGRRQTLPDPSDAFGRCQAAGPDRLGELLVVLLVLVCVSLREVGDRFVERVALAQVGGHGDRVPGPRVGPRQRPSAYAGVKREPERSHQLGVRRALHIAELTPIEMAAHIQPLGPAEVDVAGGLHHPLSLHHPLTVLPVPALAHVRLKNRCCRLLDLQEQRVLRVAPLEQDDERPGADAADTDHLAGRIHDLEAL